MITLFSIPKPFVGHIGVIQANAIRSWTRLPGCEVILFGEETGLAETAAELGVRHVPEIGRNELGTPLISEAFEQVRRIATRPLLAYVNADILFTSDLMRAANIAARSGLKNWLVVGRRYDMDIREPLAFGADWEAELMADVRRRGALHEKSGIDYFLFPNSFPVKLPPFAVGRPGWDSWLIYRARNLDIPVIDATGVIAAVHQNHPPAYRNYGVEAQQNKQQAGGYYRMGTLRDANWRLTREAVVRHPLMSRILGTVWFSPPVRMLLALKRFIVARASRAD